ncbi:MAG TPA: hypothetical protein VIL70_03645 [Chthoniobacterales bacterium]|jgi:hypothetical protein
MSKAAALRQTILEVVREHERARMLPTSIRFIYYELIAREIVSKVRTGKRRTDHNTIDAITQLHESGAIPWGYIEDETRELSDYTGYATMREAALASLELPGWTHGKTIRRLSSRKADPLPVGYMRSLPSTRRASRRRTDRARASCITSSPPRYAKVTP